MSSSATSSAMTRSSRSNGGVTRRLWPSTFTSQPSRAKISVISAIERESPVTEFIYEISAVIVRRTAGVGYTSVTAPAPEPGTISRTRAVTRSTASPASSGVISFSKRFEESLRRFARVEVFRTDVGSKLADSRTMETVEAVTSALLPPFTPAIARGPSSSAMTTSLSSRVISRPSRIVIFSPAFAWRTTMLP